MKEDIQRFRKLANYLLETKTLCRKDILKVLEVSVPTYDKLMFDHIGVLRIQASVLGRVQDFNRTYAHYMVSNEELEKDKHHIETGLREFAKDEDLDHSVKKAKDMLDREPPSIGDRDIWHRLRELEKVLPKNMSIQLIVNSPKRG